MATSKSWGAGTMRFSLQQCCSEKWIFSLQALLKPKKPANQVPDLVCGRLRGLGAENFVARFRGFLDLVANAVARKADFVAQRPYNIARRSFIYGLSPV